MSYYSDIILEKYQVRKGKKKKSAFIDFVKTEAEKHGYGVNIEKGSFGTRNIVIGDPEGAKVVYTAHYDTCSRLPVPNFITPKNFLIYLLYQFLLVGMMFAVIFAAIKFVPFVLSFIPALKDADVALVKSIVYDVMYIVFILLLFAGPANKQTANDNTSGVVTVMELMASMPEEYKNDAAYILFDYEESGLIGSSSYASKHKELKKNGKFVNFDCVSDGDTILFAINKRSEDLKRYIERAYVSKDGFTVDIPENGDAFYPSDQKSFKNGVGVAALKKTKKGLLYMDRIHTSKDTVFEEKNIEFLVNGSIELTRIIE